MTITPETWISIGLTLFAIAVGGGLTWLAAHKYYVRAAKEMEADTKKLTKLHHIELQSMEDAGLVKLNRNATGEIIGMVHYVSIQSVTTAKATMELSCDDELHEGQHHD